MKLNNIIKPVTKAIINEYNKTYIWVNKLFYHKKNRKTRLFF